MSGGPGRIRDAQNDRPNYAVRRRMLLPASKGLAANPEEGGNTDAQTDRIHMLWGNIHDNCRLVGIRLSSCQLKDVGVPRFEGTPPPFL